MSKKSQHDFCCTKENPPEAMLEGGAKTKRESALCERLFGRFDDGCRNLIRVCIGRSPSILESANPAICVRGHRNPDGGSSIGDAVTKRVNGLCFVITGKPLIVVRPVHADVPFDIFTKLLTDLGEHSFLSRGPHHFVGEVCVHA